MKLLAGVIFLAQLCSAQPTGRVNLTRPNIIYMLADDLGYGDLSAYQPQGKIRTPHIDRLAAQGMRFTDAHSPSGVCTPTRYALLTGRYPWRSLLPVGVLRGYSRPLIEADRPTVASLLQSKGYQTAVIGKWHLGLGWTPRPEHLDSLQKPLYGIYDEMRPQHIDFSKEVSAGPNTVGFGYSYILPASLDMPPYAYLQDHRLIEPLTAYTSLHKPDTGFAGAFWREGLQAPSLIFMMSYHSSLERRATSCARKYLLSPSSSICPFQRPIHPGCPSIHGKNIPQPGSMATSSNNSTTP